MTHIKIKEEDCIGCGICTEICNNFDIVDGKAVVKNPNPEKIGCNEEAKNNCPTKAIIIEKEN